MLFNKLQKFLLDKKDVVEITKKSNTVKSVSQNSYREVLISLFAIEIGETREYIKQDVYKKVVNRDDFKIYYKNTKKGYTRSEWLSVNDMDKEQTATHITRFRNFASTKGVLLLSADEYKANKISIDNDINKYKEFI